MGEVYEARDTRLGRTVAIKVLPAGVAVDAGRLARFEREARSVSKLSHPHVCTLHDVGEENGVHFLVLEHCEGDTLAGRLGRGPLPLPEVLRYGAQIAEALDAAHRRGIVHRDLKPANIMLTSAGVKLLDFGLARMVEGDSDRSGMVEMATVAKDPDRSLTAEGTILGTYPYMAPEQVEGGETDARSDIFSLGAVLYEMATGQRAFQGKSAASVMAAVLKEEPQPLSKLQSVAPPALDHVVSRCLAKDPEERWQSARDVAVELRWIAEAGSQAGVAAPVAKRRRSRERLAWAVAAIALLAASGLGIGWAVASDDPRVVQAEIVAPAGTQLDAVWGLALSPDGKNLVFATLDEKYRGSLWLRPVGSDAARQIPGTEGGGNPFWSPDGRHIGFFADGQLKRVALTGGPAQTICAAPSPRGGTWSEDGTIVFNGEFRKGLYRVAAAGSTPVELTRLDEERGEISHRWPHFLPGGRNLLFLAQTAEGGSPNDESTIEVVELATGERKRILEANSSMAYAPGGHLLFARERTLLAQRFDARKISVSGDPVPLAGAVEYGPQEQAVFSVSAEGTLVYQKGQQSEGNSQLVWFDRQGRRLEDEGPVQEIEMPQLSNDGRRVAYGNQGDIWIRDLERDVATRLTFHPAPDYLPIWSPDDEWVVFASMRDRPRGNGLYRKRSSGAGEAELLIDLAEDGTPWDWHPEGDKIVFQELSGQTMSDLRLLSLATGTAEDLLSTRQNEMMGSFSPDGNWVVYALGEEQPEIFVTTISGKGRWQVSPAGGVFPRWSADGREIVYLEPANRIMAVEVSVSDSFRAQRPRLLFEANENGPFSLHPDGERILATLAADTEKSPPLSLIVNWPELLRR